MPKGVPVATVAIDNAKNAALLALRILSIGDEFNSEKLTEFAVNNAEESRNKTKI